MNEWLDEVVKTVGGLFGRGSMSETILVVALALLSGAWVLSIVSDRLGASRSFFRNSFFLTGIGLAGLCAAMALPAVLGRTEFWMVPLAAGALLLVLIVPLTALVQRGGYFGVLGAWILTLLTVAAVLTAEPAVKRVVEKISDRAAEFGKHRVETEMYK